MLTRVRFVGTKQKQRVLSIRSRAFNLDKNMFHTADRLGSGFWFI